MPAKTSCLMTPANTAGARAEKGFVARLETYEQIFDFAEAMAWTDEPFYKVLAQWQAARSSCLDLAARKVWGLARP